MKTELKRGTRIEYSYAGGKAVLGKVLRRYTAREIAIHARTHGPDAAAKLPEWIPCELTDEHGTYSGACHISQLRIVDNRRAA
jgi:hypothetical protein